MIPEPARMTFVAALGEWQGVIAPSLRPDPSFCDSLWSSGVLIA
jgi:hypothetical protein